MNIPFVAYTFYHICIEKAEKEANQAEEDSYQKETIADIEKLKDHHSPSSSNQSSRASSPLPPGFSDISVDESEWLEEFLNDPNVSELPRSHHSSSSSSSSSWDLSDSQTLSQY